MDELVTIVIVDKFDDVDDDDDDGDEFDIAGNVKFHFSDDL
jgi:hypothetical protein